MVKDDVIEDFLKLIGVIVLGKLIYDATKHRCPTCNYPVDKTNAYCPNCGQPLNWRGK